MRASALVRGGLAFGLVLSLALSVRADETTAVEIKGLHLCCRGCEEALNAALSSVDGVHDLQINRKVQQATFTADNDEALRAVGLAMTEAGFFGEVTAGGEPYVVVVEEIDENETTDRVTFDGVHLCCGGCARAIVRAFADYDSVVAVDCDTDDGTVTFTGQGFKLADVRNLLHKAGYHGRVKR